MTDYIDRAAAITSPLWAEDLCPAAVLNRLPAADVAPVVYGKWILDAKNHCHCSRCLCGRNIETQIGWNYCPACGVKMILEDD